MSNFNVQQLVALGTPEEAVSRYRQQEEENITRSVAWQRKEIERGAERIRANLGVLSALVQIDGIDLSIWGRGRTIYVNLGMMPRKRAERAAFLARLRAVRVALGCKLSIESKTLEDPKTRTVETVLGNREAFPGVEVKFTSRLPTRGLKALKCRIVKTTSYHLACEA